MSLLLWLGGFLAPPPFFFYFLRLLPSFIAREILRIGVEG